ncbi:VanZ family protein [Rathayibacter sp. YIM 133350]|uniref:VanZ family protein n=1 Tax=Rathayibacter sp. YIM 133350 TaxID=3131992 RepID=UPI00307E93E1
MKLPARATLIALAAFVVYLVTLALIAFWPTHVDQGLTGPIDRALHWFHLLGLSWVTYGLIEASANVVLFVPFGVLLTVLLGARRWWLAVLIGIAASGVIELGQALFLEGRTPSYRDVLANSLGGLIGAALAYVVLRMRSRGRAAVRAGAVEGA